MELESLKTDSLNLEKSEDLNSFVMNWKWKAVLCLIESPDFNPSATWCANRLNITVSEAVEAIEGLERLGYVKRAQNTFLVNDNFQQTTLKHISKKEMLRNTLGLMTSALTKLSENDKYTIQFLSVNQDIINEYAPKFMQLYSEMNRKGRECGSTDVTISQISFSVLTNSQPVNEVQ